MKTKLIQIVFYISYFLHGQNPLDNYLTGNYSFNVIGDFNDGIDRPRDLDFHPTMSNQLWVLNQGEDVYLNNTEYITNICIPRNIDLTFTIYDSHGDGICCESGNGSYQVSVCDSTYAFGGDFESNETTSFMPNNYCDNSCPQDQLELEVIINTDDWAKETSWILENTYSEQIYAKRLQSGGSTVIYFDVGLNSQTSEYRKDSYSRHFMHTASSIAFDNQGFFANTLECQDANNNINGLFSGPTLWDSDLSIYAVANQESGGLLGSHLDMIHQSPYSMGIEYAGSGNIYWVFDGYHSSIVRYDFAVPHEVGGHDHSDGKVWRYDEVDIRREEGIPSHMVLDENSGFLYICDTGNQRILKFNVNSGNFDYDLNPYGESLQEYWMMQNAEWEIYINDGLNKPSGIDLFEDRLLVSDYATGEIIIYDISDSIPIELGRIDTGNQNNIMGIKIGPNHKIWYVNYQNDEIILLDYNSITGDINNDGNINIVDVVILVDYILGSLEFELEQGDINNDGIINIVDIVQLVNFILN